ncbi:phage portal protein [Shewanella sp. 10N.286.54.B9]|uniref:phage portal protein n=1 Tax=Shewanella sp. 10N.286.54.B9 TaxID=3229719 RepID=UPI003551AEF8
MVDATLTAANDDTAVDEKKNSIVTFNLPEQVMPNMWLTDYDSLYYNEGDGYWEPPVDRHLLANLPRRNAQHGGIVQSRANMAASRFKSGGMSAQQVNAAFLNLVQFGDVALLKIRNGFRQVVRLFPLPSYRTRVSDDGGAVVLERDNQVKRYKAKDIIWVRQYDPVQQVYGCADYLGGLQAALLGEDATLFRRKYFINGAHMGFIMYATDPNLDPNVEKDLQEKIQNSKGVGNFKSLFVNIPNGKEKGLQIIPVGNFESKDEFGNVKTVSSQDVFNAHRFPPGLGGMVPTNTAGFGDPEKYDAVYFKSETKPLINNVADAVARDVEVGGKLRLMFDLG